MCVREDEKIVHLYSGHIDGDPNTHIDVLFTLRINMIECVYIYKMNAYDLENECAAEENVRIFILLRICQNRFSDDDYFKQYVIIIHLIPKSYHCHQTTFDNDRR